MSRKIFVQLGRAGDILNVLPLAKKSFDETLERPWFMVAKEFADLLEGFTYVEPVIYDGDFTALPQALFQARKMTDNLVCPQIYGVGVIARQTATSFAKESWDHANAGIPWGSLPLVVDNRNPQREAVLANSVFPYDPNREGVVVVALKGVSAPFPYGQKLLEALRANFKVLDVSNVRAERMYDMLGIIDHAACFIVIDTGLKHLAHASKTPVIALTTQYPSKWHGSPWRKGYVDEFYYDEFAQPEAFTRIIGSVLDAKLRVKPPRIFHVWSDFTDTMDEDTRRRHTLAVQSWNLEHRNGRWFNFPVHQTDADSRIKGDPRPVPFLKDLLDRVFDEDPDDRDIIAFTNCDVLFAPGITGRILHEVSRRGCAHTHRWDFAKLGHVFHQDSMVRRGKWYAGSDAFFMSVGWWKEHRDEFPDMLIAREHVDEVLRQLMKLHGGQEIEAAIYHERHESFWECSENCKENPGNLYNKRLAQKWFKDHGLAERDWIWWDTQKDRSTK